MFIPTWIYCAEMFQAKPHWRFYRSASGRSPVEEFLDGISAQDQTAIAAAMLEARTEGMRIARHVVGDLYELRATGVKAHYRLLFTQEAKWILLAIDIYDKDSQRTPEHVKRRALERLRDWRQRGATAAKR
jgi:phage-related protein